MQKSPLNIVLSFLGHITYWFSQCFVTTITTNIYFLNTVFAFFPRKYPGCGSHSRVYQDWNDPRQVPSDHLWPGWGEKNPGHLEELLRRVTRCGVYGGLQWCREDPGDKGDLKGGPESPTCLRQTCASVSHLTKGKGYWVLLPNIWDFVLNFGWSVSHTMWLVTYISICTDILYGSKSLLLSGLPTNKTNGKHCMNQRSLRGFVWSRLSTSTSVAVRS